MIHARTDYDRIQDPALQDPGLLSEGSTPIAEDEPVMLFRAQDQHAPAVARFYAGLCAADDNDVMEESSLAQKVRMLAWQEEHGAKQPDMPESAIRSL